MDCLGCPELDLGQWGEKLQAELGGRRYPLGGTLEITDRCNLACVHCYINQPAGSRAVQAHELSTAQMTGLLDRISDAGCLFLVMTGGEPLLRADFADIYRHARRRGMLVTLFTNATLVTPEIADLLADWRPFAVDVTLYGATAETYERVTQVPGSYARCRRGINLLLERGLRVSLKTILMTINRHELDQMRALADGLGVLFRYDGLLWPRIEGDPRPSAYQIPADYLVALDLEDPERRKGWEAAAAQSNGHLVRKDYVYSCGAGLHTFHIDSAGRMSICTMARRPSFDLLQMSFDEAWERLGDLRKLRRRLHTECETCTVGGLCTQCPGWSQVVHGDDETPVSFVCELGKLRAARLAVTAQP